MAHGKDAARDLVWGRQGGRWADLGADHLLDELRSAKEGHLRAHAETPCDQRRIDNGKSPICPLCHPDLHARLEGPGADVCPDEDLARMADARHAAGLDLSDLERAALEAFPQPARLTIDGYR